MVVELQSIEDHLRLARISAPPENIVNTKEVIEEVVKTGGEVNNENQALSIMAETLSKIGIGIIVEKKTSS